MLHNDSICLAQVRELQLDMFEVDTASQKEETCLNKHSETTTVEQNKTKQNHAVIEKYYYSFLVVFLFDKFNI